MKILVAHNAYQQRGGEDSVFNAETLLLEKAGHQVKQFLVYNDHITGVKAKIRAAVSILRNPDSLRRMGAALDLFRPDIVHIHNFFPTLSPAVIEAAAARGIPVILTLHNYRPICAGALLMRNGGPCEDCVGVGKWRGIWHRCYRGSMIGSACAGLIGPYLKKLAARYPGLITFIALTEFARSRYVADGFPPENIVVRGNCIADPGAGEQARGKNLLYVGRLSAEKGVETLIEAAGALDAVIEVIGDGPDRARLEALNEGRVRFLGPLAPEKVIEKIKQARALLVPSRWYEGFPVVVLEAMATATPVIASRIGSLAEIVEHGQTGFLVDPFDVAAWAKTCAAIVGDAAVAAAAGHKAREAFLARYSEKAGIETLVSIYNAAVQKRSAWR